ncbi:carcinoembryonic antigen-related cell adhesion molecule 5-like isoform X4 [Gadus morhua]|uniref:carcinoembryonic antigen-related cell adhesion molecule 5-like isoform X4 n=1 Tax=Gadus morhua TaxID=8049 RepID=UPI0011B6587E|nr:carcinoembryonic antigen-related cell adhesion molecule 5-like isoform X4 [Gadus morhua]
MHLRSAAGGFLAFLLSVPVLQGNGDWRVTYSSSNVCALRGATVYLSCTYEYPDNVQYRPTTVRTLWFTKGDNYQPVDLEHDADYTGRVDSSCGLVKCTGSRCHGTCTLRIRDLRQSDSAVYKVRFTTNQPELECHSICGLAGDPPYIWFRNGLYVGQGVNYRANILSGNSYLCAVEGYEHLRSTSLYAPKTPSVTVSPSGEIEEGRSVTLSCSSEANPAATYTWFKVITDYSSRELMQGPQLHFGSILSSDSGQYYCLVQTELRTKSESIYVTVKYGPKQTSVLSSPSGQIVEGSSVTLSCSSDANPAAEYTWFKNNQPLLWGPSQRHTFPSVRPEDRGTYHCQAENKYGHLSSNSLFLDVQYAPKTPSRTMSPSGEIEEGSSVTLSCSSDANPAANYTWFREHEDSVKGSRQNYTITNITSVLGGNYFCQAHNAIGLHSSPFLLITVCVQCLKVVTSSSWTTTVAVRTIVVFLATVLLLVFLWMRRKRAARKACGQGGRPDTVEELLHVPVYENISALTNRLAHAAQREPIEEQDGRHCAIVHTSHSENQEVTRWLAGSRVQSDQTDEGPGPDRDGRWEL